MGADLLGSSSCVLLTNVSYLRDAERSASYAAPRATIARRERMSEGVPLMCHQRKTMQRSCVLQVNSICVPLGQPSSFSPKEVGIVAYVHNAPMVAHVHAAVIHMRMIHCDCCCICIN
jgi:hypothetical protein